MQVILTSDGDASFAIFIYEGSESDYNIDYQIGFDAGNQIKHTVIEDVGLERSTMAVYRIDGMNTLILLFKVCSYQFKPNLASILMRWSNIGDQCLTKLLCPTFM